jgi:branched-chain amino acid transport system substrate-binding protein
LTVLVATTVLLTTQAGAFGKPSHARAAEPILIGVNTAKTGILAPYDTDEVLAFKLRVSEINAAGGVLGRPIELKELDTKSDPAVGANNVIQLVQDGAVALVMTCDFDNEAPGALQAKKAGVPAISVCAADPKAADVKTLGRTAFTMASGTDVWASSSAEWSYKIKNWRNVYILNDDSIEYSKSLGKYFKARFTQLGGKVVGEDKFTNSESVDASAQVTRLRTFVDKIDFIAIPSWLPGSATVIRQIRSAGINTPIVDAGAATDGPLLTKIAGKISNFYTFPYGCMAYCTGQNNPKLTKFATDFRKRWGHPVSTGYPLTGYDLADVYRIAIERANSTNGAAIVKAIETMKPTRLLSGLIQFSSTCHKPIRRPVVVVQYTNGKPKFVQEYRARSVPNVGDGNPCR